jgi:outer membrane receptor protein involved in Fe transport
MRLALRSLFFLFVLAGLLISAPLLYGQATTGSITGHITDPSHAVVPGVAVTAQNEQTGIVYKGESDNLGTYVILALPPGSYTVSTSKSGFSTATAKQVGLVIDQKQLLNFELKVGADTTEVSVTAAATMLQTQTTETGTVIHPQDVLDLPLLGRNFMELTQLSPGVISGSGNTNSFNFGINGGREYANSVQIDGVESTTNRTQDITVTPSVDSVEEFKVSTSAYAAEFGRSAGGMVSVQTRGGTNQFHGTAYEFFRPNFMAAENYAFPGQTGVKSNLKQHNYGGTLGGPIIHDKTFFFISYEGVTNSQALDYLYGTQPFNQIKVLPDGSVDLSGLVDPLTGHQIPIFDPVVTIGCYGGCASQFPGNIIPANRVSQAGLSTLMNFFPQPNRPGIDFGWYKNFQVHSPRNFDQKNADARLDHNFSDKDRLSFVFHYTDSDEFDTDPYWGHTVVQGGGDGDQGNHVVAGAQEYSVTETHIFSPRFLNEARFGYTRYRQNQYSLLNGQNLATRYGVGNIQLQNFPATNGYPWIYMGTTGNFIGGSTYKPYIVEDNNFQISDNVTLSQVGKHDFKFGGDFRRLKSHPSFSLFPTGNFYYGAFGFSMTSDWTFATHDPGAFAPNGGNDIADLLLGLPLSVQMGLQLTDPHTRSWEMHFYGQDTYRISPRFTLNYGLRYEFQAPFTEAHNDMANYDPATDSFLLASVGGHSAALVNSRKNNFGPRVGFAYQVNPKTVLRAGYGFFYSPENDAREDILTKNYPYASQVVYKQNPYAGACAAPSPCDGIYFYQFDQGIPRSTSIPVGSGQTSIPTSTITNGNLITSYYVIPTLKTGYTQNYNLTLQQELGSNFTVEAGYVGSVSHDLSYKVGNINRVDPVTGNPAITPNLGIINGLFNSGYAFYNSFQTKVTKRVSHNLNFLASYTYSRNVDNGPAPWNLGVNNDNPQDPYNLKGEIASADNDVRHNFVFSGLYRLPFGKGQAFFGNWGRVPEAVFGGWQINSIFIAHTGTPVNVIRNSNNAGYEGLRPDLVGDPTIPRDQRTLLHYFNTAAFSTARFDCGTCDPLAVGNAGRNLVVGPGYVNVDFSIFKEFAFTERFRLQTRLEAFNAFNTPHFSNPGGDMGNQSTFGQITNAGAMRVFQIAGKIIF